MGFSRRLAALVSAGMFAVFAASSARAGDPPPVESPPSEMTEILLRDGIPLVDLLRLASAASDIPILWSDQDKAVNGKKLMGAQRIRVPKAQTFDAVRDLIASEEIVLVPIGSGDHPIYIAMDARMLQNQFLLKVRPEHVVMDDAMAARLEGRTGLFVETTIRVPGLDNLRDVRTALSRLVTGQNVGNVQEIPSAQALVITDFAPNVVSIYRLLKAMPARPEPKVEFFPLANARAGDVEAMIADLLLPRTGSAPAPAPATPADAAAAAAAAAGRLDPLRVVSDPATNQVIVAGTPAQIELVRQIITRVDVPPRAALSPSGGK
jgi:hypothetical protein